MKNHIQLERFNFSNLRLIAAFVVLFVHLFFVSVVNAQTQQLTIQQQNISLEALLSIIEKEGKVVFFYIDKDINISQKVSLSVKNQPLTKVLDELFKNTQNDYRIDGKQIYITKKTPAKETKNASEKIRRKVTGKVLDVQTGEPLVGANVWVKESNTGTITDINGEFSLNISSDDRNVNVSYLGYERKDIVINDQSTYNVFLSQSSSFLEEVIVVGYGSQTKSTLTGAVTSIDTEALVNSPNSSVANVLSGKVTGISTVQSSGQPGKEDPAIYVRGLGSLTPGASSPLILVDGVERPFSQMDPNEIESISVLKDASATAVFGVRGANGVIMVTTRRGKKGAAKISVTSSVGLQMPTRVLETADSYTYATIHNEMRANDNGVPVFSDYVLERFRLKDEPIMFPDVNWTDYIMNKSSMQTQHNVNISGGSDDVKYFVSLGLLYQNGLFKQFPELDYDNNYNYRRYNYRTNLDLNITKTTTLNIGIGGIVGDIREPYNTYTHGPWYSMLITQPFSSPGIIDGKLIKNDNIFFQGIQLVTPLEHHYGRGTQSSVNNRANFDLSLKQDLSFLTKGLSFEVKGAYNTNYQFDKVYQRNIEIHTPYYTSTLKDPGLELTDPNFDKTIVYRVEGINSQVHYRESNSKARNWYFESSLRYNRKFGDHNLGGVVLYTQNKRYYPQQYPELPTAYVGLVGRLTYDYRSKYLTEFNVGYNGSENFAPGKRFGLFPAGSLGYVLTEESFMKEQNIIDYFKVRASLGLVGNDNIGNFRYLYLQDSYMVDVAGTYHDSRGNYGGGYNFGYDNANLMLGAKENRIGNPNITWEKSFKQNLGLDLYVLDNRLKFTVDLFKESRRDILINRLTIPLLTNLTSDILPVVNLGKVNNKGYEIEVEWNQTIDNFNYWINANVSYAKNKIIYMDEIEPNEAYMARTGRSVGEQFGYIAEGFYNNNDFDNQGNLISGLPDPIIKVYPGDVKFKDLNNDDIIDSDDQTFIGYSDIPQYIFGFNHGLKYKGFHVHFNWIGATNRNLLLVDDFRKPFRLAGVSLLMYHVNERWTPETAETATFPRITSNNADYNYNRNSSLFVKDGSYIRLKNLTIGYDIKKNRFLSQLGISKLTINLTGYNLLTFDKFNLIDPENTPTNTGYAYPITKMYNLGVNINF